MISDTLLINLKILSKIQKNGRISRSYDGIISLEHDTYYQAFRRFLSNDSRKQAIFEINSIVTECIATLHNILNSKYTNNNFCQHEEYSKNCDNLDLLITELRLAKIGIENLKFTYQNDQNTVSQLDIIILKVNTTLKEVSQKLSYLRAYTNNNDNYSDNNYTNNNYTNNDYANHPTTYTPTSMYAPNYSQNDLLLQELENVKVEQVPEEDPLNNV